MIPNNSPWLFQLKRSRPIVSLGEHASTDVAIVGGGIAGIATAFFILKYTNKKILLFEADKIAHGATGHNAGQVTSYFERPLHDIAEEFGLPLTAEGQRQIESAWSLIDDIYNTAALKTPIYRFEGYAGYSSEEHLTVELKDNLCRVQAGIPQEQILVARESDAAKNIPSLYAGLYTLVAQDEILSLLETNNREYIACSSSKKGCMNSALFTEELAGYLAATYPNRFSFFEGSKVSRVVLGKKSGTLEIADYRIAAHHIVLCTNGFENFHIVNEAGPDIETSFHHTVRGRIGYMAGYIEPSHNPPVAISYYPKMVGPNFDITTGEPYYYLTRRPFEHEAKDHRLVCIGGPEKILPNEAVYSRENGGLDEIEWQDEAFLQGNYRHYPAGGVRYEFFWHGLMGYTQNGLRRVGYEPVNRVLLYNLGCNGVGILPSLYGGKRISQLLSGLALGPSIFDPKDQRTFRAALGYPMRALSRLFRRKRVKTSQAKNESPRRRPQP